MEEAELWEGRMVLYQQKGHRYPTPVTILMVCPGEKVYVHKANSFPDKGKLWVQAAELKPLKTKEVPMKARISLTLVILILLVTSVAGAAPLVGNKGGCASYWTKVACTVVDAGRGWAFGDCEFKLSFSGVTPGPALKKGQPVLVNGCQDETGNLYDAGRKYPLVIRKR